jgi:hypothetical protein
VGKANILIRVLAGFSVLTFGGSVFASPITGGIGFVATHQHIGSDLSDETLREDISARAYDGIVSSFASAGIETLDPVTDNDFTCDPTSPVTPIWTIDGFTLDLVNISLLEQSELSMTILGSGDVNRSDPALDDTFCKYSFNATQNVAGTNFVFSSSFSTPEPYIALLLGAGLIGLGIAITSKLRKVTR